MAGFGCQGHGVNIHPTGSGAHSTMIQGAGLEWVNGAPVEDATAVLQLLKEYMPFLTQRIEDNFEDWSAFPHSPAQTLRIFMSPRCVWLRNITGHPSVGWIRSPIFLGGEVCAAFDYIRSSTLSESDRQRILSGNAMELYSSPIRHCEERSSVFHREA